MNVSLKNTLIEKYFDFLTRLDNDTKRRLVVKLTESIDIVKEKNHMDISNLFGAWEDSRSSEEIINDIKTYRVEKRNAIEL